MSILQSLAVQNIVCINKDHLERKGIKRLPTRYYVVALITPIIFQLHRVISHTQTELLSLTFSLFLFIFDLIAPNGLQNEEKISLRLRV